MTDMDGSHEPNEASETNRTTEPSVPPIPNVTSAVPGTRPQGTTTQEEAARSVRAMFARIAPRYDLLNRLLSFSLDKRWRRRVVRIVTPRLQKSGATALDVCCGTGDLALELARVDGVAVTGCDFVPEMIVRARAKSEGLANPPEWVEADALALPFPNQSFDVATVAFGLRNLADYRRGIVEMVRVLRPNGMVAILEFNVPESGVFAYLYRFYFNFVIPRIGNWLSGESGGGQGAYRYLPDSVVRFPSCETLAQWMGEAGLAEVRYQKWMGGAVALHTGTRPSME